MPGLTAETATQRPPFRVVSESNSWPRARARSTACTAPRPASVSSRSDSRRLPSSAAVARAIFVPPKSIPRTKSLFASTTIDKILS
jgi:hypothetical protein